MANGYPADPESPTGQVRLVVGDDVADADGNFLFSDDAIAVALSLAGGGIKRAVATLVKQLALQQTLAGQSIKASDFAINNTNRGSDLLKVAESYEAEADAEDAAGNAGELAIVNTKLNQLSWNEPIGYGGLL